MAYSNCVKIIQSLKLADKDKPRRHRKILTVHELRDFLERDNVNLDATLGGSQKHAIKPILLIFRWGSPEVDFW